MATTPGLSIFFRRRHEAYHLRLDAVPGGWSVIAMEGTVGGTLTGKPINTRPFVSFESAKALFFVTAQMRIDRKYWIWSVSGNNDQLRAMVTAQVREKQGPLVAVEVKTPNKIPAPQQPINHFARVPRKIRLED